MKLYKGYFKCRDNTCEAFKANPMNFDPSRFYQDACSRCNRFYHTAEECDETHTYGGIPIPDDATKSELIFFDELA